MDVTIFQNNDLKTMFSILGTITINISSGERFSPGVPLGGTNPTKKEKLFTLSS